MAPRRGRRGAGSVYWHASRRQWRARLRWTDRLTGRAHERELAAQTREEARDLLVALRRERDAGRLADPSADRRLEDHCEAWLASKRVKGVREHVVARYERGLRLHVLPALGPRTRLRAITPEDLTRLYRGLLARGQAPASAAKTARLVSDLLATAVRWGLLDANPAARAERPRAGAPERRPLSPREVRALLDGARESGDRLLPLWALAAGTGLRIGEATGLRWDDLTLPADGSWGRVRVDETLVRVVRPGTPVMGEPKTRSARRELPLPPSLVALLRTLPRGLPKALVFRGPQGGPLTQGLVGDRLRAACRRAGVTRRVTFHDFRRFFASEAFAGSGGDLAGTSAALGHGQRSGLAVTLDVYVRAREGGIGSAVAAVERALTGGHR